MIAAPEYVAAAATDLANIGSANAAATFQTPGVLAAGADEVSEIIAALFGAHAQAYQAFGEALLFGNGGVGGVATGTGGEGGWGGIGALVIGNGGAGGTATGPGGLAGNRGFAQWIGNSGAGGNSRPLATAGGTCGAGWVLFGARGANGVVA